MKYLLRHIRDDADGSLHRDRVNLPLLRQGGTQRHDRHACAKPCPLQYWRLVTTACGTNHHIAVLHGFLRSVHRLDIQPRPEAFGKPLAARGRWTEHPDTSDIAHGLEAVKRATRLKPGTNHAHPQRSLRRQQINRQRSGCSGAQARHPIAVDQGTERHGLLVEQCNQVAGAARPHGRRDQLAAHLAASGRYSSQTAQPDTVAAGHGTRRYHGIRRGTGIRLGERGNGCAPVSERGNIGVAEKKRRGNDLGFLGVMHSANLAIGDQSLID
ncbi:hypothetical protein D3C84_637670 [compost metagenome]